MCYELNKNKLILEKCPNFYRIVNFEYFEEDAITEKLIKIYESFIFNIDISNNEDLETVKKIDYVLGKYIDDFLFRRKMQKEIMHVKVSKTGNVLKTIVESIIQIFNRYEEETLKNIYIAKWI